MRHLIPQASGDAAAAGGLLMSERHRPCWCWVGGQRLAFDPHPLPEFRTPLRQVMIRYFDRFCSTRVVIINCHAQQNAQQGEEPGPMSKKLGGLTLLLGLLIILALAATSLAPWAAAKPAPPPPPGSTSPPGPRLHLLLQRLRPPPQRRRGVALGPGDPQRHPAGPVGPGRGRPRLGDRAHRHLRRLGTLLRCRCTHPRAG